MKIVMIAALAATQLPAAANPAQAAEMPRREAAAQPAGTLTSMERTDLRDGQTPALIAADAPESSQAAQEDKPRKKRKSTGDKVLTGAAVILGIGALAVGGLLVAIAVQ